MEAQDHGDDGRWGLLPPANTTPFPHTTHTPGAGTVLCIVSAPAEAIIQIHGKGSACTGVLGHYPYLLGTSLYAFSMT